MKNNHVVENMYNISLLVKLLIYFRKKTNTIFVFLSPLQPRDDKLKTKMPLISSSLPNKEDKRIYLPTVSAGWLFSSERFISDNLEFLSSGKIKAGWGKAAQTSLYMPLTSAGRYGDSDFSYSDIKWRVTNQTDAGIELQFLEGKLSVAADYYYKTTNHILENEYSPEGSMQIRSGQAKIINRGWEFSYNEFTIKALFSGATDLYLPSLAIATPFEQNYTRVNCFSLKSLNISYSLSLRFIGLHGSKRAIIYTNAENLLYKTNASLKNNRNTEYSQYPINRMFSLGLKINL